MKIKMLIFILPFFKFSTSFCHFYIKHKWTFFIKVFSNYLIQDYDILNNFVFSLKVLPDGYCEIIAICCHLLIFFKINFFRKIISEIPSECQTDSFQVRPDISLGLIWIQFVYKGYEQTTLVDMEVKLHYL